MIPGGGWRCLLAIHSEDGVIPFPVIAFVETTYQHGLDYALQNPTPKTIERALELLWQSGDFDEWQDFDGQRIAPVWEPSGWRL